MYFEEKNVLLVFFQYLSWVLFYETAALGAKVFWYYFIKHGQRKKWGLFLLQNISTEYLRIYSEVIRYLV